MVHTIVDGTFRQTNLTNESPDYLRKCEELHLAEIGLMRHANAWLSCAVIFRRVLRFRTTPSKRVRVIAMLATRLSAPYA